MVSRGVRYEDAQREFEKRFIAHVLAKADGNLCKAADLWACTATRSAGRSPSTASAAPPDQRLKAEAGP